MANPVVCYMIVQPDPRQFQSPTYHVKFGDGPNATSYSRANANHWYVENHNAHSRRLQIMDYDHREREVAPGKWLEWQHIKLAGGRNLYEGSEWHQLDVKPGNSQVGLRQNLLRMLELFPNYNRWGDNEDAHDPYSVEFEQLVDTTWGMYFEGSLAQFTGSMAHDQHV